MTKVVNYIKDSIGEIKSHVTWTSWPELQKFTTIVIISLIILTLLILVMDKISEIAMLDFIYGSL